MANTIRFRTRLNHNSSLSTSFRLGLPAWMVIAALAWALFGCTTDAPGVQPPAPVTRAWAASLLGQALCERRLACGVPDPDDTCVADAAAAICSWGDCGGDVSDPAQLDDCLADINLMPCGGSKPATCEDVLE